MSGPTRTTARLVRGRQGRDRRRWRLSNTRPCIIRQATPDPVHLLRLEGVPAAGIDDGAPGAKTMFPLSDAVFPHAAALVPRVEERCARHPAAGGIELPGPCLADRLQCLPANHCCSPRAGCAPGPAAQSRWGPRDSQPLRAFQLRDHRPVRRADLVHHRPGQVDVGGGADERQRDQVNPQRPGEFQVVDVLAGQRRHRDAHAGQRNALVVGEGAAFGHRTHHVVTVDVGDDQSDLPSSISSRSPGRASRARPW